MGNRIGPRFPRFTRRFAISGRAIEVPQILTLVNCWPETGRHNQTRTLPGLRYKSLHTHRHRLGSGRLDFLALTDVSGKCHDFAVIGGRSHFVMTEVSSPPE